MPTERWTTAMREAWYYALSTVERGMSALAGLTDYRTGGGHIRTEDWYFLVHTAENAYAQGSYPGMAGWDIPLPRSAYAVVDIDYEKKYVAVYEVWATDKATGLRQRREVTVESDESLSIDEWNRLVAGVVEEGTSQPPAGDVQLGRSWFYSPSWAV